MTSRIRDAISRVGNNKKMKDFPPAFHMLCWELMKTQTRLKKLEQKMDKQINKVKRDVEHNNKPKAKKYGSTEHDEE